MISINLLHFTFISLSFYLHFTFISPSFHFHFTFISPLFYFYFTFISPPFYLHFTVILPSFQNDVPRWVVKILLTFEIGHTFWSTRYIVWVKLSCLWSIYFFTNYIIYMYAYIYIYMREKNHLQYFINIWCNVLRNSLQYCMSYEICNRKLFTIFS